MLQVCAVDFTAFHFLRPLMHASRDAGWEVTFACTEGPWAARLRAEGFAHWAIPMSRSASPIAQLRAVALLARRIRGRPPDLVHTHTPIGGLIGRAASLFWRGPVIHTFHGLPLSHAGPPGTRLAVTLAERVLARRTAYFLSQARGDAERAVALGFARAEDTVVIGNGVDIGRFRPDPDRRAAVRAELAIPDDAVVVLITARLVREKGLLELADAALALRGDERLRFLVAGSALASDRTSVEAALDAHAVVHATRGRWIRLGHRQDPERPLAAADIFVLPTYREGLPRSIIEAMATSLPVIATRIPACAELVREEVTGLLVPVRDARALAAAIVRLAGDATLRRAMGERGRALAVAQHDERAVVAMQLDVFRKALAR